MVEKLQPRQVFLDAESIVSAAYTNGYQTVMFAERDAYLMGAVLALSYRYKKPLSGMIKRDAKKDHGTESQIEGTQVGQVWDMS